MGRHGQGYEPPTFVPEDDQNEKQPKADRRHDQEVHRADACGMVVQKGLPSLRRPSPTLGHILGHRRLRDLDAELEQFAVDAGRTPQPIGQAHFPDQTPDLPWYPWPTTPTARLPAPIQSKACAMPPDNRLRLDYRHSVHRAGKQAIEPD